jgi:hypothetical protein
MENVGKKQTSRYADQLAATESEQFRERVEDAFHDYLSAKAQIRKAPASRRARVFGQHLDKLIKKLQTSLRESTEVYSDIAMACSRQIGSNLLAWVGDHISADLVVARDEERIHRWVMTACGESDARTRPPSRRKWA